MLNNIWNMQFADELKFLFLKLRNILNNSERTDIFFFFKNVYKEMKLDWSAIFYVNLLLLSKLLQLFVELCNYCCNIFIFKIMYFYLFLVVKSNVVTQMVRRRLGFLMEQFIIFYPMVLKKYVLLMEI